MEKLVLDGKEFVKAARAAKDLGYTSDYVGQLCRSGKVSAHLVGRSWYVNVDELGTHKVEKKRISRTKAREQAKKAIAENKARRLAVNTAPKKEVSITYEHDDSVLIPETRKLDIQSETVKVQKTKGKFDTGPKYVVENEGNKILMKGSLDVVDVTDGEIDQHTTVLSPKIIPGSEAPEPKKELEVAVSQEQERRKEIQKTDEINVALKAKTDFKDRLIEHGAMQTAEVQASPEVVAEKPAQTTQQTVLTSKGTGTWRLVIEIVLIACSLVAVVSVAVSSNSLYERTKANGLEEHYTITVAETIAKIRDKI